MNKFPTPQLLITVSYLHCHLQSKPVDTAFDTAAASASATTVQHLEDNNSPYHSADFIDDAAVSLINFSFSV
jgi:hypothetical protein